MIKMAVAGSEGRMGQRIIRLAELDKEIEIAAKFDIGADAAQEISKCDVLIEFTSPKATVEHVAIAERLKKGMVIGTTGLSGGENDIIDKASKKIPIVISPNMSLGVNLLFKLCGDSAAVLPLNYGARMTETHHVHKKDAPSGTAKKIAELISKERKQDSRYIQIESIREGEVVGDHKVIFENEAEKIELLHSAKSRDAFAAGAIAAAKFIYGKKSGLFTMADVLGI